MRHFTNVKDLGDLNIALKDSKSCNEFGYECDGARYQSGGMEA